MDKSRREQTKAQNRETILTAARGVFAAMGFAAASVRDIIRATPLASGTFYNYFKSKEEVYQALRDDVALAVRPQLREARAQADTAEAFLSGTFRTFFRFIAERRGEAQPAPETSRFRMDSPEVLAGFVELKDDIAAASARGLLPAVDEDFLSAALAGVALEMGELVKAGADVETATAFATALFLGGLPALPVVTGD
ncbi:MAG: transcriptional regulator, TetR family [Alphaproteobacteria bacterium]|nr:transcriptional regulator, TetR family [Alphaproteobacteria bacterium]